MLRASTAWRVLVRLSRRARWLILFALGVWAILLPAFHIFGEHIADVWTYQSRDVHRFTAMSMLEGSLQYHRSLVSLAGDEEVYNGAGYTHWGYGVPLLQIPFHAAARLVKSLRAGFFPDRAIFFVYLALTAGIVWIGMDCLLALREPGTGSSRLRRHALSWAAAAFMLGSGLYPIMAGHFHVYDETIAYFVMIELVAMSAYVFFAQSSGWAPMVSLGVAAGMGLLTRPTGAIFLAMWTAIVLLERPSRRTAFVFLGSVAPFVLFWLATNWVRTGYPWSMGFQNSLPGADHVGHVRFGSLCVATWEDKKKAARAIFDTLFVMVPQNVPWMEKCGLKFEPRTDADVAAEPYLGAGVGVVLLWTLLHHAFRRERRLALYLPHVAFAGIFAVYVNSGAGFAWRYVGDFMPLVFLAGVQYVQTLPLAASSVLGWPLAAVLLTGAYVSIKHDVEPSKNHTENLDASQVARMWQDFEATRGGQDKTLPSSVRCGAAPDWPHFNVFWRSNPLGWSRDCTVGTITEVFLGVPPKPDDSYVVRFETGAMSPKSAQVYVNGRMYTAQKVGTTYETHVQIHYASLTSPVVLVSIEWIHALVPGDGKLLAASIE
jgi:hypothetical protein